MCESVVGSAADASEVYVCSDVSMPFAQTLRSSELKRLVLIGFRNHQLPHSLTSHQT